MDSKKPIDIGASAALIELKAELHRQHGELIAQSTERGVTKSLKVKNEPKGVAKLVAGRNRGIEKRSEKDAEEAKMIDKTYEKAKYVLEAKVKLYDEMNSKALTFEEDHPVLTNSLVDFQRKAIDQAKEDSFRAPPSKKFKEDWKWTEFTDYLGRTRRVLKTELAAYIAADDEMKAETEGLPETSQDDLIRQQKREKWEQQAAELADKKKVHYQDILFDEIREHGTGYYGFSKDDEQRAAQLSQLKKLSEETAATRKKIEAEKRGKKAQMKERLRKIKARRRAKLGLPPEEEEESEDDEQESKAEEQEVVKEEPQEEESKRPPVDLRAWDFGKPGVYGRQPTNFDELDAKWLKDRRMERQSEFAPPLAYAKSSASGSMGSKYQNFVRAEQMSKRSYEPIPPTPQHYHPIHKIPATKHSSNLDFERGRGMEVAPPPTYEYYHGDSKRQRPPPIRPQSEEAISEAIAQGIENFRKEFEQQRSKSVQKDTNDSD